MDTTDATGYREARSDATSIQRLIDELSRIDADLRAATADAQPVIDAVDPVFHRSAVNLVQYLALRRRDIRWLQVELAELGLSSLGRSEGHILASIEAVLGLLHALKGEEWTPPPGESPVGVREGDQILARNTEALLGPAPAGRRVRIMVTAPTEAATDVDGLVALLDQGMDCLRINCAHDDVTVWERMIVNLRRAERETGRRCLVMMDLAGPKLRTGPIAPGPQVVKWRPERDSYGRVINPARIWLGPAGGTAPGPVSATLPLPADWLARRTMGDRLTLIDSRGARRDLTIVDGTDQGWLAECGKTAYVATGTELTVAGKAGQVDPVLVGELPPIPGVITLRIGDSLVLTRDLTPGRGIDVDNAGRRLAARIGCTLPDVFNFARPGERIWFDDGKIGGVIRRVAQDEIDVEITRARSQGSRLRGEKGINLPDTDLALDPLTEKDLADLPFVARQADMIGLSFVRQAADVAALRRCLHELGPRRPGIVLKIETRRAFEQLPELIMDVMGDPSAGLMIARGDLAVEAGFERLAEVQEEILWIAEAAHLPVIWATQVLETLARTGIPSRSEITDAAMGQRAECVMLNKGPHIAEAVDVLDGILRRMTDHQQKKRSLLRQLRSWSADLQ
jgi:pyruvate kinase